MKYLLLAAMLALTANTAAARDYTVGSIEIKQPWARATPKGASVAGGFMTITNKGTTADRLVGGSSPVAGKFEVHEMKMEKGIMKMRPLASGLEIKPGATVELRPGSYHVMFTGLKQPLVKGKSVKGTLVFETAGTVEIEYSVEPVGAPGPMDHGGMKMQHGH